MRTLLAGVLGGIAMFIWATIVHVATPLATIGLSPLPDEASMIATLHHGLGEKPGLYFFPFMNGAAGDAKAMADQTEKLKSGPSGLLVYEPPASAGLMPRQLGVEFGLEVVEALLTAVVLGLATGFWRRLGLASVIGLVAAMATNFSYWNWYGFSLDYTLANAFTELMKFVVAGGAISLVLGWRRRAA
jgi:hypothetical protein